MDAKEETQAAVEEAEHDARYALYRSEHHGHSPEEWAVLMVTLRDLKAWSLHDRWRYVLSGTEKMQIVMSLLPVAWVIGECLQGLWRLAGW